MWLRGVFVFVFVAFIGSMLPVVGVTTLAKANSDKRIFSLGGHPLCEVSAAAVVDCPDGGETCILVADNEIEDSLFLFEVRQSKPRLEDHVKIDIDVLPRRGESEKNKKKNSKLSDIEALVRLADGSVLVVGSHSRNSSCRIRAKRRFLAGGRLGSSAIIEPFLETITPKKRRRPIDCDRIFPKERDKHLKKACAAIIHAEQHAQNVVGRERDCGGHPSFNIEGAMAQSVDGEERVWIGLRAPLVDGAAMLLRLEAGPDAFKFDAVAFLDIRGQGIRELAVHDGTLWGIAGPVADANEPHMLWRMDLSALKHGARREPKIVDEEIPTSAEGLAIHDGKAFIFMDGDEPEDDDIKLCSQVSTYMVLDID